MFETIRRVGTVTSNLHRAMKDMADTVGEFLVDAFHFLALFAIGATTVWSAGAAFIGMVPQGVPSRRDIRFLFIYLENGAMCCVYFVTTRLPVRYHIHVVINAPRRSIVRGIDRLQRC